MGAASRVHHILQHDTWAASHGVVASGPVLVRFRTSVLEVGEADSHHSCIEVVWPYAPEGSGAMPDDADGGAMSVFEKRLCDAWENDGLAVLAAVLTFDGARQWVFYTDDVSECATRLGAMPHGEAAYPIELTTHADPDWAYLRDKILLAADWQVHQAEWRAEFVKAIASTAPS